MPFARIAEEAWRWIAETGIDLALLVLIAFLIPRAGRFANRLVERQVNESGDTDEGKTRLAIANVGINVAQIIAFFLLLVFFLQKFGFSLAGAAIPATVVSAAIGFGAQSIIADFLAGFFILTEKQFGVGDFVTFQGSGLDISGDVIQITMRSTHIRTLEQATVAIPNSTARIAINYSNYWSSALVVIPVPLLGSTSADQAAARAERAARRALAEPEIARSVRGDLVVHPAVEVNPPATVGMPWTMDVRFLVRVEPLSQWMVERAIRVSLLNEFWEEYGSAPTMVGTRLDRVVDHPLTADNFPPTELMRTTPPTGADYGAEEMRAPAAADPTDTPTEDLPAKASNDGEQELRTDAEDDPATDALSTPLSAAPDKEEKQPRLAFGGRMRLSTAVLIGLFLLLLIARGLTLGATEADPGQGGILAPPPRSTAPSSVESPAPQQSTITSPTAEPSTPAATETQPRQSQEQTRETQVPPATRATNPVQSEQAPQDNQSGQGEQPAGDNTAPQNESGTAGGASQSAGSAPTQAP